MAEQHLPANRLSQVLPLPLNVDWNDDVREAYHIICEAFDYACEMLKNEDNSDAFIRYAVWAKRMKSYLSLVDGLAESGLDGQWISEMQRGLLELSEALSLASKAAKEIDESNVIHVDPVSRPQTGNQGRPKVVIDYDFLREAFNKKRNLSISGLARLLNIHRHTLRKVMKEKNISNNFTDLSDAQLDELARKFTSVRPDSGLSYARGFVRSKGIKIQEARLIKALQRVRPLAQRLRAAKPIKRREYYVKRAHSLWHMDGHHKLINWGIVIHGTIDGYSRYILSMEANISNSARTVYRLFRRAVRKYGKPSRVRGDRGGENMLVAIYMIRKRGVRRGSFLFGSSTRNTRIERTWVEVGSQFGRRWKAFFMLLEESFGLDRKNPHHLWILTALFLDTINEDCQLFVRDWNHKSLKNASVKSSSPHDLVFTSKIQHGRYLDPEEGEWEDVDAHELQDHYGVDGHYGRPGTGAGHPLEEEGSDVFSASSNSDPELPEEVIEQLSNVGDLLDTESENSLASWTDTDSISSSEEMVNHEIRHKAVKTPRIQSPFEDADNETAFFQLLQQTVEQNLIPPGFGLLPGEAGYGQYKAKCQIPVGIKRNRMRPVTLPEEIWKPRFVVWAQALAGYLTLMLANE